MKYYLIAGEASGDLHASNLMKALHKADPAAEFRFWGGDLMASVAGKPPVKHYRELAFMGFLEVARNLPTILRNIRFCKEDLAAHRPDVLILVDYPGFNLRIAEFAKNIGIKVVYYISPQLWAWKEGRVKTIRNFVDEMLVILPFEEEFYKKHRVTSRFVGHPLGDALGNLPALDRRVFKAENHLDHREIIAVLPGSRRQEIEKMLTVMLSVRRQFPEYQFVIAGAPSIDAGFYRKFTDKDVKVVSGRTYPLLQCSAAALVTSGTATLETALLNVPQVVCYRSSRISYEIARRVVKNIKYISLVNLIMDEEVVKELIQDELTTENLTKELKLVLGEKRERILRGYQQLHEKLGQSGASEKAAEIIVRLKK